MKIFLSMIPSFFLTDANLVYMEFVGEGGGD